MLSLKLVRGAEALEGVRTVANVPPDQAKFVIGRDSACDWTIPDKQLALSARHCEILRIEGRQVLRDTSTNGTFVNGSRHRLPEDHVLRHGDRITFGGYTVEVSVVPDAAAASPKAAAPASAAAPRRGGDPAAMVGSDWQSAGLVARVGPPAADVKTGFTRISKPPPRDAQPEPPPTGSPARPEAAAEASTVPQPGAAREPARRAPPGTTDVLQRLAGGLGVPVDALGVADPAIAAERVARLLRVAVLALHHQMGAQSRQLRELGSRAPLTLARSEAAPLRVAPGPQEAVAALLAAGDQAETMLVLANRELAQHAQRLQAAFNSARARLGDQLDPASLERMAGGGSDVAALWKIYRSLWTALGLGVGKTWSDGYAEAAGSYLAAAYDELMQPAKGAPGSAAAGPGGQGAATNGAGPALAEGAGEPQA